MNWGSFNTYGLGQRDSFETMNNQLFERFVKRSHLKDLKNFQVVNGSGGDGGIEAYAEFTNGDILAVQSKWFLQSLDNNELGQIKNSVLTAKKVRPTLKEYIICIPHDPSSVRVGKGGNLTKNDEEKRVDNFVTEIYALHPDLKITWWFDNELLGELQQPDNEGVHKFWFEKEVLSFMQVNQRFILQKENTWLKERYVPDLNGLGIINREYHKMIFSKDFRKEIYDEIEECLNKLRHGVALIRQFLLTKEFPADIKNGLENIESNLHLFDNSFSELQVATSGGNSFFRAEPVIEANIWKVTLALEALSATHLQKGIRRKLIAILREIHKFDLPNYLLQFNERFNQYVKFFYGRAGTGKTQGLAFTTEAHLGNNMPAVIIQAKNSQCNNWTDILSDALDIRGWNTNEILSALETLAIRSDNLIATAHKVAEPNNIERSTAVICVDGIEEAIGHETQWASRVRESVVLSERYPRIRFVFSARDYYSGGLAGFTHKYFESISLPFEGDVQVGEVAEKYLKHYNIELSDLSIIKGIDSLLALKLFCELYKSRIIGKGEEVITATRELLKAKVERINKEYIDSLADRKGSTQEPVKAALFAIAKFFYTETEIEHELLKRMILDNTGGALSVSEVDLMIDHFDQNGILLKDSRTGEDDLFGKTQHFYSITYQSITEHILAEQTYLDIKKNKLDKIPNILHAGMISSPETLANRDFFDIPPNQKIIQSIVNRLFIDEGQLIGDDGFLSEGFSADLILELRLGAILVAENEVATRYEQFVDRLFHGGPASQFAVLKHLILPSCSTEGKSFGADYLHNKLKSIPSAFERDKLWSGLDIYEDNSEEAKEYNNNVKDLLDITDSGIIILLRFEKFNENPMLFAWALSNVDQVLRNSLRIALTGWAIKNPLEFVKLLDKIFDCNDPQIQEDLSSVALGIATHLIDTEGLKAIADWATLHIFSQKQLNRNVIVRQGFRAIIEKSGLMGIVTEQALEMCKPSYRPEVELIDLDERSMRSGGSEIYPITHDLAWYVINNAYEDFLEIPVASVDDSVDQDVPEAKALLDLYRDRYGFQTIYAHSWAMAAAVSYIKNVLGLTRTDGNGWTRESHGSKSKIYTYEEKYTWLAVHYLQGYLSDYIPAKVNYVGRAWIEDYSQLTEIPNPGEEAISLYPSRTTLKSSEWIIKEELAPTLDLHGDIDDKIRDWVNEVPKLDFLKWIYFDEKDFPEYGIQKKWLALSNETVLAESSNAGISNLKILSVIIKEADFQRLYDTLQDKLQRSHVSRHLDRLYSSPDTGTYSNPTDIVWMKWIGEAEPSSEFYTDTDIIELNHTIVKIVQETVHGEKYYRLPSKLAREFLNIQSYSEDILKDKDGNIISFIHKKSEGSYRDSQEIVLADSELLKKKLSEIGLRLIWFCDFFKKRNPLNESLKENVYDQRTIKYLVWEEGGILNQSEFWNAYFSDTTDEEKNIEK